VLRQVCCQAVVLLGLDQFTVFKEFQLLTSTRGSEKAGYVLPAQGTQAVVKGMHEHMRTTWCSAVVFCMWCGIDLPASQLQAARLQCHIVLHCGLDAMLLITSSAEHAIIVKSYSLFLPCSLP